MPKDHIPFFVFENKVKVEVLFHTLRVIKFRPKQVMGEIFHRDALLVKVTCLGRNEDFALLLLSSLCEDTRVAAQLILVGEILQLGEKHLEYLF